MDWLRMSRINWLRVRLPFGYDRLSHICSGLNIRPPFVRYGILRLRLRARNRNVVDRWVILPSDDVFDSE